MADYKRMYNDLVATIKWELDLWKEARDTEEQKASNVRDEDYVSRVAAQGLVDRYEGKVEELKFLLGMARYVEKEYCEERVSLHLVCIAGCKLDLDVATREDLPRCVFVEIQHCVSGTYSSVRASIDQHMDFARESACFGVPMTWVKIEDGSRYWWEDDDGRRVTVGVPMVCVCHYRDTAYDFVQTA